MSVPSLARQILAVVLLLGATWLLVGLVQDLSQVKGLKTDRAEIHHVRYGLLDADQWVERIGAILDRRVDELDLTEASRAQVTAAVTDLLDTLIREIERNLRQRPPSSSGGWLDQLQGVLQQGLQDLVLDVARLRDRVPDYAEAFVAQLGVPGVKEQIKTRLRALLADAVASSGATGERARLDAVLERHGCTALDVCSARLDSAIDALGPRIEQRLLAVIGLVAALFAVVLVGARASAPTPGQGASRLAPLSLLVLVGATLLLLVGGLATPMIEVDARISDLSFRLLGEQVVFTDQVLYFQTKSILDVMRILFETGEADMLLVAVLLTLFSLVFPTLKLLATFVHHHDLGGLRESALVRFFALQAGKWSMADVMVVAIFMAYIGFDALVANQLGSLQGASQAVAVLTTNGTSLEPGFYLFLAFVLAGLLLSMALERDGRP